MGWQGHRRRERRARIPSLVLEMSFLAVSSGNGALTIALSDVSCVCACTHTHTAVMCVERASQKRCIMRLTLSPPHSDQTGL